jgi:hypothetical protein
LEDRLPNRRRRRKRSEQSKMKNKRAKLSGSVDLIISPPPPPSYTSFRDEEEEDCSLFFLLSLYQDSWCSSRRLYSTVLFNNKQTNRQIKCTVYNIEEKKKFAFRVGIRPSTH